MNTEHLQRIKEKCRELLAIAEKRTVGKWKMETVPTSCGVCHKIGPFPGREKGNHACVYVDYHKAADELQANAAFIASCAGPAEAGWRATIAAIDLINAALREIELVGTPQGSALKSTCEGVASVIIAAWPEELL